MTIHNNIEPSQNKKIDQLSSSSFPGVARRKTTTPVTETQESFRSKKYPIKFWEISVTKDCRCWRFYPGRYKRLRHKNIIIICAFLLVLLRFIFLSNNRSETTNDSKVSSNSELSQKKVKKSSEVSFETSLYNQVLTNTKGNLEGIHKLPPKCDQQTITPDSIDITLVTQLSIDRLWMMQYHCQRWNHKISLIVYSQKDIKMTVDDLRQKLMHEYNCSPDHIDRVQLYHGQKDEDYPVNKLRNLAISAITTTHFLYIDVDFWVSTNLYSSLITVFREKKYQSKKTKINPNENQLAVVVPAFQIHRGCREYRDCRSENLQKMPENVLDLIQSIKDHDCLPFDPTNKHGHGSTMYKEWLESQLKEQATGIPLDEMIALPCIHSDRYEPYVVLRYCDTLPPYQQEFVGYGKNKMTWIMHLQHYGYQFVHSLLNGGFLVHYPHLDSPVRQSWNDGPEMIIRKKVTPELLRTVEQNLDWMKYKRGQVDALYVKFRHWLQTQPASIREGDYGTPYCPDADENRIIQDEKLWVSTDLLEKYD